MNIIFHTNDDPIRGDFIRQFYNHGLKVFATYKISTIFNLIKSKTITAIFIDIDHKKIDWIDFLRKLKTNKTTQNLYIFIITSNIKNNYLNGIIMEGVDALYFKNQSFNKALKKVIPTILSRDIIYENRKYSRITPKKEDNIVVSLELKKVKDIIKYNTQLLDISAVSALLKFEKQNQIDQILTTDKYISSIVFNINDKIKFSCDGLVLRRENNEIVIKYQKISAKFKNGLAGFLSEKINH